MNQVQFAKVHMFPYSDRARTRANLYSNKIADDVKKQRKQRLIQQAFCLRERFIGRKMKLLTECEASDRPGKICGHTDNFLMVWVPSKGIESNQIIEVELLENGPDGLLGQVVKQQGMVAV
jgi:threonylcarbamoyladenosine tRNA methylthiotransferase MtaB